MTLSGAIHLLAELPMEGGEWATGPVPGDALPGWTEARLLLSDGHGNMRIVLALFDAEGRPGAVSDMVSREQGRLQESVQARVEPDGVMRGTHWDTEGDRNTPRDLTQAEVDGLRRVAREMWARVTTVPPAPG